ncbi:MgtC/SapB family protein [Legionella sp. W05-934-2]|jgi:uncharacterized membrane protein (DUF4010 family)|uniref:MgtC/SapB family protein n=1 Tax=Legionella sp. W05-934-2 TaxID=1198649 RepID=UPI003462477F
MFEQLQPFAIAFVIGLLIGIERERNIPKGDHDVGMRTFILYALFGVVVAELNLTMITLTASFFVFIILLMNYQRKAKFRESPAITTEISAGLVYLLGILASKNPLLSLSIGFTCLLLLLGRKSLHQFARDQITQAELQAVVTILIISLGILSFIPNKTIDPWQLFNPQQFGFLILVLSIIQFGSHLAIRIFGETFGMVFTGFLGGMVSSTAVFATLSANSKTRKSLSALLIAAVFAIIGTLVEFLIVLILVSPKLALRITPIILPMIILGCLYGFFVWHQKLAANKTVKSSLKPLEIKSIVILATVLISILVLVTLTKRVIGEQAIYPLAFITGLFELQGMTYAIAVLFVNHQITITQALEILSLAITASYVSKFMIVWTIARNRFAAILSMLMLFMWLASAALYLFLLN